MANTTAGLVTTAKPKVGGAIWVAPVGTELPTDAQTPLNIAFKSLGYISDEGVENPQERTMVETIAWGGDVVNKTQKSFKDSFAYTLIEAMNVEVLKHVFGEKNVSGNLVSGITIKVNSEQLSPVAMVVETVLKDGALKRLVIPHGVIEEVNSVKYNDNDAIGYGVKLGAIPGSDGDNHYEYIVQKGEAA